MNMGKSAVLSVGSVDIAIISQHIEPADPSVFDAWAWSLRPMITSG